MAVTIVLTNQKGGVGKTTSSCALAAGLTKKKQKVLAVDLDPQGNFGFSLGLDIECDATIYEVLKKDIPVKEAIYHTEYCDILISNILLSEAAMVFQEKPRELLLKTVLESVQDEYDYIIIDTPPSLNILTLNGYAMADYLIIPMAAEILSLVGLVQLKDTMQAIKTTFNPNLNVLGILLTRYNKRTNLSADVLEMAQAVAEQIDSGVFDTKIRSGIAIAEAPAHGLSIYDYSPRSNSTRDYAQFVKEVLSKVQA